MVMDTLGDTLAKTEVETLCDRKAGKIENLKSCRQSPKAESLVDALADSLADINVKTLGDKLVHVEAEEFRGDQETWPNTIRGRHCMRTSKEGTCGGGSKSYFVRAKVKAKGLNETLRKRLPKKYVGIFNYASSWIQTSVLLDRLMSDKYKRR